jgi:hypothetical protein
MAAYSRFPAIYLFSTSRDEFICAECPLVSTSSVRTDWHGHSHQDTIAHIEEHLLHGHRVDAQAIPRLKQELEETTRRLRRPAG